MQEDRGECVGSILDNLCPSNPARSSKQQRVLAKDIVEPIGSSVKDGKFLLLDEIQNAECCIQVS